MALVTYIPNDEMPWKTTQYGYDFKGEVHVEVDDPYHLSKFRGNPFFNLEELTQETAVFDDGKELTYDELKSALKELTGQAPRGKIGFDELVKRYKFALENPVKLDEQENKIPVE